LVFLDRRLKALVVSAGLALAGCGPDRRPDECIAGHPNFVLLITAPTGKALSADLTVMLHYGGSGVETFELSQTTTQRVLFCRASTLDGGTLLVPDGSAADGGAPSSTEALRCELWTGGPAQVEIDSSTLAHTAKSLTPLASSCPLDVTIPVSEADGG
jgi:hypothetical protein